MAENIWKISLNVNWKDSKRLENYAHIKAISFRALEPEASYPHVSLMPGPTPQNTSSMMEWATRWHAVQQKREERKEKLRSYCKQLHHLIQTCENALEYEPSHPYIRQIPAPTIANTPAMMDWAEGLVLS